MMPPADHQQRPGERLDLERTGGVDQTWILGQARQPDRLRAGRDDALLEVDPLGAVLTAHLDDVRPEECADALHHLDLALLGQDRQSPGELLHDGVLPLPKPRAVDRRRTE